MRLFSILCCLTIFSSNLLSAQSSAGGLMSATKDIPLEVYVMLVLILFELIIIVFLANSLLMALGYQKKVQKAPDRKAPTFFQRINRTVALEDEALLDLKHDYDGISELDNKTPQWWSYAFYFTILFGVVYLYRMFGNESLPSQLVELKMENQEAEILKASYLSLSASNVDENSVSLLGQDDVMKGAMTFKTNCVACHGEQGEGNIVGPNLTDAYWIHKGGIKDIFTTIKYGYPEKGMKSWKDDFSPLQIAQLASFVKSLQGSNPPNAKDPQGELYSEVPSTTTLTDTLK